VLLASDDNAAQCCRTVLAGGIVEAYPFLPPRIVIPARDCVENNLVAVGFAGLSLHDQSPARQTPALLQVHVQFDHTFCATKRDPVEDFHAPLNDILHGC